MSTSEPLTVVQADEGLWREYDTLAARSYGHPVDDITRLYDHGDARVAVRGGRVVAGGLGLLLPQFFGGQPVPSACMGSGCVAPEERGKRLAVHMLTERIRALQEQGAVLATLWTTSTGYAHREGWEAPTPVFTWSVPTEELKRSFDAEDLEITHGTSPHTRSLQRELAARWNGPVLRPEWWDCWKQDKNGLTTYRFNQPGHPPTGLLSLVFTNHPTGGTRIVVHDFWAADARVAVAMFGFLGRHTSRIRTVEFQRTGLPPHPQLVHNLHRAGSASAHNWHPWMLRILDVAEALRLRGWPTELDLTIPIELDGDPGDPPEQFTLRISSGAADVAPTTLEAAVRLTRRQLAVWYAGGYRTTTAAALAGVRGEPRALATLIRTTAEREPWLPDHF
jgi:predicted acetyltransferase